MEDRPGEHLTGEEAERATSLQILALLADIEEALQTVKLYVADALLRPESEGEDDSNAGG